MKLFVSAFLLVALFTPLSAGEKPRVIVSTDVGGDDPDDHQSMVHYLVYADRFDTEGFISSPPKKGRAKDLHDCIDAYEKDFPNLQSHSDEYPTPESLRNLVHQGAVESQTDSLPDAPGEGARCIITQAKRDDPRPLYVLVWGAITDVAQAVHADPSIKSKLRIYSIGSWNTKHGQKERDYLFENHPDLWWIESDTTFRGLCQGGDQEGDLHNLTFSENHIAGHGELGALFMRKKPTIKMGDTPTVLHLLNGDPSKPEEAKWGGAYVRPHPKNRPHYWTDNPAEELSWGDKKGANTINRWREEILRDWQKRMDRTLPR
ncbi:MAG: DUF1593 domain-containing protein [Verrucomicrobiales bacterium]|nr:DUF1593 domain-containing protein [Verrucomicrobiales bacterium]